MPTKRRENFTRTQNILHIYVFVSEYITQEKVLYHIRATLVSRNHELQVLLCIRLSGCFLRSWSKLGPKPILATCGRSLKTGPRGKQFKRVNHISTVKEYKQFLSANSSLKIYAVWSPICRCCTKISRIPCHVSKSERNWICTSQCTQDTKICQ